MKVFISWSGGLSKKVAIILKEWIPDVIQSIEAYVSSEDIEKGSRWNVDISKELESTDYGILCVTKENVTKPWINFEAGALSKSLDSSKVCPFLIGLKKSDLKESPLLQFQATNYEKEDIFKLMKSMNRSCGEDIIPEDRLKKSYETWWESLNEKLKEVFVELSKDSEGTEKEAEPEVINYNTLVKIEEILDIVRMQERKLSRPAEILPPDYIRQIIMDTSLIAPTRRGVNLDKSYIYLGNSLESLINRLPDYINETDLKLIEDDITNVFEYYERLGQTLQEHIGTHWLRLRPKS